jgi:hypothetical protein
VRALCHGGPSCGDAADRMPRTAAPSGMHASPMSACNGSERRPRALAARRGAAGNTHRSRSHGPTANATIAALLPPFDLPHDGNALAPPSTSLTRAKRSGGVLLGADMLPPDASTQRRLLQAAGARPRATFRRPLCELRNVPHAVRRPTEAPPCDCHGGSCVCSERTSRGARACMCISRPMDRTALLCVFPFRLCRSGPLQSSPLPADAASRFPIRCMHNGMR